MTVPTCPARSPRFTVRALTLTLSLICGAPALLLPANTARAQSAPKAFSIPAGALQAALQQFGRDSGLTLSYEAADVENKQSPGLNGSYDTAQALTALLAGTGMAARRLPNGSYAIRALPTTSISTLPSITVTGRSESPTAPMTGYIATRAMSAGKDDTALAETPQSITVVTRDQMNEQGAQTVTDALRYVAGVNTSAYGEDPRYDWITVRGFNQSVFGMYRDGLRASGSKIGMRIDPYGLERIEVLKGPTSVLYGQNSPGGLINTITKRPTDEPVHEVSVGAGSHDRRQVQFDLGGPVTEGGTVAYRLTGNLRDSDTQMHYAPDDHLYIAPALTWRPSAATSFTVLTNFQHDKAAWGLWYPRAGTLNSSPWGRISSSFYPGEPDFNRFDRKQRSISTLFEHTFENGLVFRQGLRAESMEYNAKYVRGRALLNDNYAPDESGHLLYRDANRNRLRATVYTMDNQLAWTMYTGAVEHRLLIGMDTSLTRFRDRQLSGPAPVLDILDPQYGQHIPEPTNPWQRNVTARQTGVYLQDRITIADRLILRGGVRFDRARTETRDPLGSLSLNQHDNETTFQGGMLYRSDSGLSPFFNYSESFQPTAQASKDGSAYKPTYGRSVEAGVRYLPQDGNMMLSAAIYQIKQNNVLTQDPRDADNMVQTGQVRSRGLELEGTWSPSPQWTVLANYTYMDAEVTRSNTPGQIGTRPQDGWGTTSPRHMASMWATYRQLSGLLQGASLGVGVRYIGSTLDYGASQAEPKNNYAKSFKTPAYTIYDAMLAYEPDAHWRFALKVNNIFDKLYVANPCGGSPLSACYYGPRRTAMFTTTYRW